MNAILDALFGVALAEPGWLLLLGVLPAAAWLRGRRGRPRVPYAPIAFVTGVDVPQPERAEQLGAVPRSWRVRWRRLPIVLQLAGLAALVVALGRPVERDALPRKALGIDVLLCLDRSSSMAATDLDPERSRLAVAKTAAAAFVAGRPDDRIGLVGFARYADVLCPVTLDRRALVELVDGVTQVEAEGPEDATGIGTAVARAAAVLRRGDAKSKVVVLLTDGEENVATAATPDEIGPAQAAAMCEELGVRVYTIAAGRGQRAADGRWVAIDTTAIQRLAERTGGAFYRAEDAAAVTAVYAAIDELEKVEFEAPRFIEHDRYLSVLAAGGVLFVLGILLGSTVWRTLP